VDSDFRNPVSVIRFEVTARGLCIFFKAESVVDSDRAAKGRRWVGSKSLCEAVSPQADIETLMNMFFASVQRLGSRNSESLAMR
jgi:hypothetical protein